MVRNGLHSPFVQYAYYLCSHGGYERFSMRNHVFLADDFRDTSNIRTDSICSASDGFSAYEREAFVTAWEHKHVNAVHD